MHVRSDVHTLIVWCWCRHRAMETWRTDSGGSGGLSGTSNLYILLSLFGNSGSGSSGGGDSKSFREPPASPSPLAAHLLKSEPPATPEPVGLGIGLVATPRTAKSESGGFEYSRWSSVLDSKCALRIRSDAYSALNSGSEPFGKSNLLRLLFEYCSARLKGFALTINESTRSEDCMHHWFDRLIIACCLWNRNGG